MVPVRYTITSGSNPYNIDFYFITSTSLLLLHYFHFFRYFYFFYFFFFPPLPFFPPPFLPEPPFLPFFPGGGLGNWNARTGGASKGPRRLTGGRLVKEAPDILSCRLRLCRTRATDS